MPLPIFIGSANADDATQIIAAMIDICNVFIILENVKEHATLSAGASVDHGVDVENT
jgi:hypothetical protein